MKCVECGTEASLVQGSCPACFAAKNPLLTVPDVLDVEVCAHCDARHVGAHWHDAADGTPLSWIREDAVREHVGVHARVDHPDLEISERAEDEKHFRTTVHLDGEVEGVDMQAEATVLVRMRKGVCDRCSRLHGGYFAAIIQLRATERDVSGKEIEIAHKVVVDELERQRESGNRFSFLAKDGPMHGGHDYYIGDIEAARNVSRRLKARLGTTVLESPKLVGRREGEDMYRVTFLVRIKLFAPGDFALHGKRLVQVVRADRGSAAFMSLEGFRRDKAKEDDLRRLGGPELIEEAVLVSDNPEGLQVLDPRDYKTVDLLKPEGYRPDGDMVPVVRHEERLYLVPAHAELANNG